MHAAGRRMVRVPDVRQLEACTADGVSLDDVELVRRRHDEPAHAIIIDRDARHLELTGWFGWDPVPAAVVSATLTLAARAWHERDNRFADSTVDPMRPSAQYYRDLPASAKAQLALYRIPGIS
ncbi:MAG: hypothetical protein M0P31_19015 [Solirubrobacteraceae bacterium]|nr:hypothetical protein [Solirubrobacteraceae bacterium]